MERTDWGWVFAKATTGLMLPIVLFIWVPQSVREGRPNSGVLMALIGLMLLGGVMSIVGIILRGTRVRPMIVGYAIEMAGIVSLVLGPLILGTIYGTQAAINGGSPIGALLCLCLASPFVARGMDIMYIHLAPKSPDEKAKPQADGAE